MTTLIPSDSDQNPCIGRRVGGGGIRGVRKYGVLDETLNVLANRLLAPHARVLRLRHDARYR